MYRDGEVKEEYWCNGDEMFRRCPRALEYSIHLSAEAARFHLDEGGEDGDEGEREIWSRRGK